MSNGSKHTKFVFDNLHPNIQCVRHPDHIGAKGTYGNSAPQFSNLMAHRIDSVEIWSHHEKVVVVDNEWAAIGGLDLCFGRWDTHSHPLADVHPTDFSKSLFPGQDYNNARVMDFKEVGDYLSNALSIQDVARMPWHDVDITTPSFTNASTNFV